MTLFVTRQPAFALTALGALAAAIWMLALPKAARRSEFTQLWQRTERAGIDPGAFNYRELPLAENLYSDLMAKQAARPDAWAWRRTAAAGARQGDGPANAP